MGGGGGGVGHALDSWMGRWDILAGPRIKWGGCVGWAGTMVGGEVQANCDPLPALLAHFQKPTTRPEHLKKDDRTSVRPDTPYTSVPQRKVPQR